MKYGIFNNPGSSLSFLEWLTIVAWGWLFVSALAGTVHLIQYLYLHLNWV